MFCALHDQLASQHAQLTRCLSAVTELLVSIMISCVISIVDGCTLMTALVLDFIRFFRTIRLKRFPSSVFPEKYEHFVIQATSLNLEFLTLNDELDVECFVVTEVINLWCSFLLYVCVENSPDSDSLGYPPLSLRFSNAIQNPHCLRGTNMQGQLQHIRKFVPLCRINRSTIARDQISQAPGAQLLKSNNILRNIYYSYKNTITRGTGTITDENNEIERNTTKQRDENTSAPADAETAITNSTLIYSACKPPSHLR